MGHPRSQTEIVGHYQGLKAKGDRAGASQIAQYLSVTHAESVGIQVPKSYQPLSPQHEDVVRELAADAPELALDLAGQSPQDRAEHVSRAKVQLWLLRDHELIGQADRLDGAEPIREWFRRIYAKYGVRQSI